MSLLAVFINYYVLSQHSRIEIVKPFPSMHGHQSIMPSCLANVTTQSKAPADAKQMNMQATVDTRKYSLGCQSTRKYAILPLLMHRCKHEYCSRMCWCSRAPLPQPCHPFFRFCRPYSRISFSSMSTPLCIHRDGSAQTHAPRMPVQLCRSGRVYLVALVPLSVSHPMSSKGTRPRPTSCSPPEQTMWEK